MARIFIAKEVIEWAVNRSGISMDKLQKKFPKIQKWFTGDIHPTLKQLETFSKLTLTPFGYLFLQFPPEDFLPIPHFRTLERGAGTNPSPDLLETVQIAQRRQDWMREYLMDQGQSKLDFIGKFRINERPSTVANKIHKILGFSEDWSTHQPTWSDALHTLRDGMEQAGIFVTGNGVVGNNTRRKLDPNEFRGFVLIDDFAPFVFINGADGKAAQMFTLAHELAHILFGKSAVFDLREMLPATEPVEEACNKVAAEFLIPEAKLRNQWPTAKRQPEPFQVIARKFKVSVLVASRRALDLDLITKSEFLDFYKKYQKDERRKKAKITSGGDFYANQNLRIGKKFGSIVIRAVKQGAIPYSDVFRLTGLFGKTFDNYASRLHFE